jgi:hypothetical protein
MNSAESIGTTRHIGALGVAPTVKDVAELLKLDTSCIYRMLYAGKLDVITGFGRTRICAKSVERFLGQTGEHFPRRSPQRGVRQTEAL